MKLPDGRTTVTLSNGTHYTFDCVDVSSKIDALLVKHNNTVGPVFLEELRTGLMLPAEGLIADAYAIYLVSRKAFADFQKALDELLTLPTTTA